MISVILLGGLLLSFSRGAWGHFAISAAVVVVLLLLTTPDPHMRARIVLFTVGALIAMVLLFVALMLDQFGPRPFSGARESDPAL